MADVFHDHALASEIRKLEQRFRLRHIHDLSESIARLVQERYEFTLERSMEAKLAGASRESSSLNVYAAHSGGD